MYRLLAVSLTLLILSSCQKKVADAVNTTQPSLNPEVSYQSEITTWQNKEKATYIEAFNFFEEKVFTESDFSFYPISEDFKVFGKVIKTADAEIFEMKTSGPKTPRYREYGKMTFTLSGEEQVLTLYENMDMKNHPEYSDYLFCPFYDETSGDTTYGGGRYLDFKIPKGDKVMIDFNKCYNPYCAYLDKFNCPITPVTNTITVAVEAGMQLEDQH